MSTTALAYLIVQTGIWLVGTAIVIAIAVPLLRWTFRINEQVELQREILLNLRRINAESAEPDA